MFISNIVSISIVKKLLYSCENIWGDVKGREVSHQVLMGSAIQYFKKIKKYGVIYLFTVNGGVNVIH